LIVFLVKSVNFSAMTSNTSEINLDMSELTQMDKELVKLGVHHIPYKAHLSFLPLINQIRQLAESSDFGQAFVAREVLRRLKNAPALLQPIQD
jgi:hypothetical protein